MIGGENGDRFIASIISAVSVNPQLAECDFNSILSAALLGEALKLSPSPQLGYFYMVPYKKKNGPPLAQFILGYRGYVQLAQRTGAYTALNWMELKEGELVSWKPLEGKIEYRLIDDDDVREVTPTAGYVAYFETKAGFHKYLYWSYKKMMAHADKYSSAFSAATYQKIQNGEIPQGDMWKYSSFWYKDFDGMAGKTMLRQLISKWGMMSTEMMQATANDEAVFEGSKPAPFIDVPTDETSPAVIDAVSSDPDNFFDQQEG